MHEYKSKPAGRVSFSARHFPGYSYLSTAGSFLFYNSFLLSVCLKNIYQPSVPCRQGGCQLRDGRNHYRSSDNESAYVYLLGGHLWCRILKEKCINGLVFSFFFVLPLPFLSTPIGHFPHKMFNLTSMAFLSFQFKFCCGKWINGYKENIGSLYYSGIWDGFSSLLLPWTPNITFSVLGPASSWS